MRLIDLALPLRAPFANAASSVDVRRLILVGIEQDGLTGWGEAAPYPGITTEDVGDVWSALHQQAELVAKRHLGHLPATAAAAIDQACEDLAARQQGLPLWARVGGSDRRITATVAIGMEPTPRQTVSKVTEAVERGFRAVKLKIGPGHDSQFIRAVREAFGDLSLAADANGGYDLGDSFFDDVDALGLAYLEQPLGAIRLAEHGLLRERLETPICLDESMHTSASARQAIDASVADIVCLKPAMLGVRDVATLTRIAVAGGIAVKMSGLIETSVGRSHTLALASLSGVVHADLTPPTWFLSGDVSDHRWRLDDGTIAQHTGIGIGIGIDLDAMAGVIEREATIRL